MKINEDVPIEAVVKYLVKERDAYKEKLDTLVPYTKRLEARLRDMEAAVDATRADEVRKMEKTIERLERENKRLVEEKTNLIMDYHKTEWFKSMQRAQTRRADTIKHLRDALSNALDKRERV